MSDLTPHQRIDALVPRIAAVEEWMEGFKLQMTDVSNEVQANTRLTEEIHGDTKEIIEAVRWMGTTKKYLIHFSGFVIAVAGIGKALGFY